MEFEPGRVSDIDYWKKKKKGEIALELGCGWFRLQSF